MIWQIIKNLLIFLLIVLGFILILLLPKEREMIYIGPGTFEAHYPFTWDLYKANINEFIDYFQTENGFGKSRTGSPMGEEVERLFKRSLNIVIPAYLLSMIFGTIVGVLQFYFRKSKRGKVHAFFSWIFSSIPDFFLYIAIQYALIKLMRAGFPQFDLYGHENWYSFIMPLIVITIFPYLHMVKFTSASLANEMGQEYLRTAYAKGVGHVKALKHMLWNCWSTIINQSQLVMIYILSSLPIIEKLSSYNGAGYQLLESILKQDAVRALAFIIPFLGLMFIVIVVSQMIKYRLIPKEVREEG
ncbi:hypothetical protein GCM10008967_02460 [Bacillus carboniphilus]|uniref:ABC transmembrane type-1 domain-containing protein n=1 Tax=Bacillus carboniphilus TaxID=86663 RepID=A0ABN0VRF6_9BACI